MDKRSARLKRALRTRCKIRELRAPRLSVHRTSQHIYAQVISADSSAVVVSASSLDKALRADMKSGTSNIAAAKVIGKAIAERAKKAGISKVAFDRSGFKYHGRVKALADSAREHGLEF